MAKETGQEAAPNETTEPVEGAEQNSVPGDTPPQESTEDSPESQVAEPKVEENEEDGKLAAALEYLELMKTNPQLQQATTLAIMQKQGQIPQGVDMGALQQTQQQQIVQPNVNQPPPEAKPEPQHFMAPNVPYNEFEALNNPASASALARIKAQEKLIEWTVKQEVNAMQEQFNSQQQVAQQQQSRVQAVQQVVQKYGADAETGQVFSQIIEALAHGQTVPGFNVYETLYRGLYHKQLAEADFNKRLEQHLANGGSNGGNIQSTVMSPGDGNTGETQQTEPTPEERVFGPTPRT